MTDFPDHQAVARSEYLRLCQLIGGRPPLGDCQLVALMLARAVKGQIATGIVEVSTGHRFWHYWAEDVTETRFDCLADDWDPSIGVVQAYERTGFVPESNVLAELRHFLEPFDWVPAGWTPTFPLRFALASELLTGKTEPLQQDSA